MQLELSDDYCAVEGVIDVIVAADVLYDRVNFEWPPRFLQRARQVLIADSRVRDFSVAGFHKRDEFIGSTWPDLDEFDEFRAVKLYAGNAGAAL